MAKAEAEREDPAALAARRQVEQQREREKRARERAALGGLWSRRDVFGRFGWSIFGAFSGLSLVAAVRSFFPRVLFTPPASFKANASPAAGGIPWPEGPVLNLRNRVLPSISA